MDLTPKKKVLCDFHHEHLYESLQILFEDRLGWELYRSIGLDWYHQGYWNVYPALGTAEQYLGFHIGEAFKEMQARQPDGGHTFKNPKILNIDVSSDLEGLYSIGSSSFLDRRYRGVTLERFKRMKFDILVSSMPQHIGPFNELIRKYQPQAKHVFQIGNNWTMDFPVKNILTSSKMVRVPPGKNGCFYHQEFNLDLFKPTPGTPKSVYNLMHYIQNMGDFEELERLLPDFTFKCYGAGNREGSCGPDINDIARKYQDMGFLFHVKREGDGYGFNTHHAAACGRPIITRCSNFNGMTSAPLLLDGITCVDLDRHSLPEAAQMIRRMADNYSFYSQKVYQNFKRIVNFDSEFEKIKAFLGRLK